jgi:predicted phage baseplate assembly protein
MSRVTGKFRPALKNAPLTFSQPLVGWLSASAMLNQDPRQALPQIMKLIGLPGVCSESDKPDDEAQVRLVNDIDPDDPVWQWSPRRDLLSSQSDDRHFVAEMDDDGRAHLRFGDGELGRKPEACASFAATYRVGNGKSGNVGADTITHLIFLDGPVSGVSLRPRNPLPARGGAEAEPVVEAKLFAAGAIRKDLQRAITADDYARLAERSHKLQRATAELRWTGSWYESRVAIDPRGAQEPTDELLQEIEVSLHPYRRVGHDLKLVPANYVPLEIEFTVCVLPHYQRGHVEAALRDAFSNRVLPGGRRGFFHPDQLTFGGGVYLSQLIATAQAVEGVESVALKVLQRRFTGPGGEIESGVLPLGATEIAQLNNDPSFPEHGKLTLKMDCGRWSRDEEVGP